LAGAPFGLIGVSHIDPFIFVSVANKNVHERRDIAREDTRLYTLGGLPGFSTELDNF